MKFRKQKSFEFFLKAGVLLVVRMSVERLFQAARPASLNARSPNFDDVRGTSKTLLSADRRPGCLVASSRSET